MTDYAPKRLHRGHFYGIPMPGQTFDGQTVIASTWVPQVDGDGVELPDAVLLIRLNLGAPYYSVSEYVWTDRDGWNQEWSEDHFNINPAVAHYANMGGDY